MATGLNMKQLNVSPKIAAMNRGLLGKDLPVPKTLLQEVFYIVYRTLDKNTIAETLKPFYNPEGHVRIESLLISILGNSPQEWNAELLKEKYQLKKEEIGHPWPNKSPKRTNEEVSQDFFSCFRPFVPIQDVDMGLHQIKDCMEQYNSDEFLFCGFVWPGHPWNPKHEWKLPYPIPRRNGYGFMVNTASGTGSHWIGLYCYYETIPPVDDAKKPLIILRAEYFDSFGSGPSLVLKGVVSTLFASIRDFIAPFDEVKTIRSAKQLQVVGLDCGIFAVHFLDSRIKGISFEEFMSVNKAPNDVTIRKYRSLYWNLYNQPMNKIIY
jgi:hypothetical protein